MVCLNPTYPRSKVLRPFCKDYIISGQLLKRLLWWVNLIIGLTILNMRDTHCSILSNMA